MDISAEKYVSLISYKRNGDPVPVAVWIAPLPDGRAGFTTDGNSYKVKRIRNNPSVVLQASDLRGKVADGAPEVKASAEVVTSGDDYEAVCKAIGKKYGLQYTLLSVGTKIKTMVGKDHRAAIVLTFG